ncbi:MAG: GMC family oxidoreductase N-terminal domain-containing protein [Gammaproteobacteria bacterium]|nr:GMC family oxidoreductase N-terminal domain-containing protein [Gammaproteobacteria bacterium]
MIEADYVIVGAGSAGCVLADRLSGAGARVLLLEAGPTDWHPLIHVPAGILSLLHNPKVNWNYATDPETGTGERPIHWPRGRVLGGSSSINGMLYVRGHATDYDTWAQMGCRGWSYEEVLPFFKRAERYAGGDDDYRGRDGPMVVEDYRTILPLTHFFVEAAQQAGHEFNPDLNGPRQEGVGYSQMSRAGRFRASTAAAYLRRARRRANLHVATGAMATRLTFEGRRCTGVEFRRDGHSVRARATREVVVSGGTVNSPHLLQVSGIGPPEHLRALGIDVVHALPGVGANLSDHYVVRVSHRVRGQVSINQLSRGPRLVREILRWLASGTGALTFGVTSAQVFCRSRDGLSAPDLQLLFSPASYDMNRFRKLEREPGATVAVCPIRPQSRGTIMARSAEPLEAPAIRPSYLSVAEDVRVLLHGIRLTRQIFACPAFARVSERETTPGADVASDEALEAFARANGTTLYHPVGTCRMGEGPMAVVDARLRVHGVGGLRVVDASIMPSVTSGNTNAPSIMIGEKGAAMVLEDAAARC